MCAGFYWVYPFASSAIDFLKLPSIVGFIRSHRILPSNNISLPISCSYPCVLIAAISAFLLCLINAFPSSSSHSLPNASLQILHACPSFSLAQHSSNPSLPSFSTLPNLVSASSMLKFRPQSAVHSLLRFICFIYRVSSPSLKTSHLQFKTKQQENVYAAPIQIVPSSIFNLRPRFIVQPSNSTFSSRHCAAVGAPSRCKTCRNKTTNAYTALIL